MRAMTPILAVVLATVLASISALHLYWAVGGPWASVAVVPTKPSGPTPSDAGGLPVFSPGVLSTVAVAVLLAVAALIALGAGGSVALPVPNALVRIGIWVLAVVLLLRAIGDFRYVGFFKRVRGTRFAKLDTRFLSPLCLTLSALAFGVALGSA